ncbi:MAG: hypothetical protein EBZ69_02115 [Alphaproteobacteria bacterium]|nr:hypothetical protein [bacterium]NDC55597.1 hypothetical protein [Alphaproteobacteria bacterium]NDC95179.1 hypothetical protein [bacterium]
MRSVKKVTSNPVAFGATINGAASAVLAVLAAFQVWTPTPEQVAAVMGLLTALEAVVAVLVNKRVETIVPTVEADA